MELHCVGNRLEDSTVNAYKLSLRGQPDTPTETISSLHDEVSARDMHHLQVTAQFLFQFLDFNDQGMQPRTVGTAAIDHIITDQVVGKIQDHASSDSVGVSLLVLQGPIDSPELFPI